MVIKCVITERTLNGSSGILEKIKNPFPILLFVISFEMVNVPALHSLKPY